MTKQSLPHEISRRIVRRRIRRLPPMVSSHSLQWRALSQSGSRLFATDKDANESMFTPRALPNPKGYKEMPIRWPKTFSEWKRVLSKSFVDYKSTFDGFKNQGPKEEKIEKKIEEAAGSVHLGRKQVQENVQRNAKFISEEGTKVVETIQETTGVYTTDDLKRWAGRQLKLANECLAEFMAGYRQGRDEELERVLNEYFADMEKTDSGNENSASEASVVKAAPRKRRKPIRRIKQV